jgi:hypothetical protein
MLSNGTLRHLCHHISGAPTYLLAGEGVRPLPQPRRPMFFTMMSRSPRRCRQEECGVRCDHAAWVAWCPMGHCGEVSAPGPGPATGSGAALFQVTVHRSGCGMASTSQRQRSERSIRIARPCGNGGQGREYQACTPRCMTPHESTCVQQRLTH